MIIKGYVFGVLYALLCLALAFVLYKLGTPEKITRKIVHILIGFEWVILNHFFGGGIHFLIVCILFLVLLLISHRKKLLPMISSDDENSPGTVYYGVAMTIMATVTLFVPDMIIPFGIGVFCTSLGDGIAGLLGQMINAPSNIKIYGNKTIYGTLFNLIASFIAVGLIQKEFNLGLSLLHILAIAFFATILELVTGKGLDNITVTLGSAFLAYFFVHIEGAENYIIPILITPIMIAFAYKKQALTVGGIVAAIIVDLIISVSIGNFGFTILLAFFVGGIITDKVKNKHKNKGRIATKQKQSGTERRSSLQVLANSLVAAICAAAYFITNEKVLLVAFVASLAEAFADTAASGIGVTVGRAYDLFRMRPCVPGISGGMSLLGTGASLIAAALISLLAFAFGAISPIEALLVLFVAFLGAIFDSFLGSLLQVKYKCRVCGTIVDSAEHCGKKNERYYGLSFVTNDTVNLLGTLFSAIFAGLLYYVIM